MPRYSESYDYCTNCSHRTVPAKPDKPEEALEWAIFGETVMWCESCQIRIYATK